MRTSLLCTATAVFSGILLSLPVVTTPVQARGKGFGTALGVAGALIIMNEAAKAMQGQQPSGGANRGSGGSKRPRSSGGNNDSAEANRSQSSAADRAKAVAEYERALLIQQNEMAEEKRNVEKATTSFIEVLETQHKGLRGENANVRVASSNSINQVTAGEVRRVLEDEYANAGLSRFDRFAGELWTRDRLMVEVLNEAKRGLKPYFEGVGAKGPSMDDLKVVFRTAANEVFSRALETSEIIGVSHSFDRFMRTIYENSDRVSPMLMTFGADGQYERLLTKAINAVPTETFVATSSVPSSDPLGMKRQFQFRFRARRSFYDCLAANYVEIATGQPDRPATVPVGLVRIDNLQLAPLDGSKAEPATVRPAPSVAQAATTTNVTFEEVWGRVETHVNDGCKQTMLALVDEARKGLEPQAARWDSFVPLGSNTLQIGKPSLQPIININSAPAPR